MSDVGRHVGDPFGIWMILLVNWLGKSDICGSGLAACEPLQLKYLVVQDL